jgi:predicted small metal-binding protein
MKTLSCKDLGNPTCAFVAEDETAEGATAKMMDHAKAAHADDVAKMSATMTPDQMKAMMVSKVAEKM